MYIHLLKIFFNKKTDIDKDNFTTSVFFGIFSTELYRVLAQMEYITGSQIARYSKEYCMRRCAAIPGIRISWACITQKSIHNHTCGLSRIITHIGFFRSICDITAKETTFSIMNANAIKKCLFQISV